MIVKKLIAKLLDLPQTLQVLIPGEYTGEWTVVENVILETDRTGILLGPNGEFGKTVALDDVVKLE